MATRKRFVVDRGGKLQVEIQSQSAAKPRASDSVTDEGRKSVLPTDEEDDLYAFRSRDVLLHFYEIDESDAYAYGRDDMQALPLLGPTLSKYQEIDTACLAALGSNQVVPLNAAPGELPVETFSYAPPASPQGLSLVKMFRQSAPYGQFHYVEGNQKTSELGSNIIRFKAPALQNKGSFQAGDNIFWPQFSTSYDPDFPSIPGQSGFKITDQPSFSAPRVDVAINGGHVNVYLKRLPRISEIVFDTHFFIPYRFWNSDEANAFLEPNIPISEKEWLVGIPTTVLQPFEGFNLPPNTNRSFHTHWNSKIAAQNDHVMPQVSETNINFNTEADDFLQNAIDDNGDGGLGYVWFPSAYNPGWTQAERDAIPTHYDDDHGFFLYNGSGRIRVTAWRYQGEFCGAFDYKDVRYYVWRYTNSGNSTFSSSQLHQYQVSNSTWQVEPNFIFTSELGGATNPTANDLHYIEDTTRDQFVHVSNVHMTADVDFIPPGPKLYVDLTASPRNYQT